MNSGHYCVITEHFGYLNVLMSYCLITKYAITQICKRSNVHFESTGVILFLR